MGRVLVGILVILAVIPSVLFARLWLNAGQRRVVTEGTLGLVVPTVDAERTLARWEVRGRRVRTLGLLVGVAGAIALGVLLGESSVFLWPVAVALGGLLGIVVAEALRPAPTWTPRNERVRHPIGDSIAPAMVWSMRGSAVFALVAGTAEILRGTGDFGTGPLLGTACVGTDSAAASGGGEYAVAATALIALCWLVAEIALVRVVRRPSTPADGDDVPVDDALRSATAHVAVGASTVLFLAGLGGIGLYMGVVAADSACGASDVTIFGLIGVGLAALLGAVVVLIFLLGWLRPVRRTRQAGIAS